jgi:hypothetical protein
MNWTEMFPAAFESTQPLFDLAGRASEPLVLLTLGSVLIALSVRFRSRRARPVDPASSAKSRPRIAASAPLATLQS